MSFLIDTDLLSMLQRPKAPSRLVRWVQQNETEIFISVISLAEIQFGIDHAPLTHKPELAAWFAETRRKLAPAIEQLTEPVLVRWKTLLADLKSKNRTLTCEDSLIAATALYHGHVVATHNTRHFEPAAVQIFDPLA